MTDDDLITYCGLYCGICAERCVLPQRARELLDLIREEGYDQYYEFVPGLKEHYPSFVKVLEDLSTMDCRCRNRRGGPPNCEIRNCADERGVFVCMDCQDFPCERWKAIARFYPLLASDAQRYREIGKERWLEEQKARGRKNFYYGMVRCVPEPGPEGAEGKEK
jgi:hypothetical protein